VLCGSLVTKKFPGRPLLDAGADAYVFGDESVILVDMDGDPVTRTTAYSAIRRRPNE